MPHKKATPEHLRPTLEDMQAREAFHRKSVPFHAIIRGLWDSTEAHFEIILKGDFADVLETFETLRENGNLMGIEMHTLE